MFAALKFPTKCGLLILVMFSVCVWGSYAFAAEDSSQKKPPREAAGQPDPSVPSVGQRRRDRAPASAAFEVCPSGCEFDRKKEACMNKTGKVCH